MSARHLVVIAFGGVTGVGLFLGSGYAIDKTARRHCPSEAPQPDRNP
jgi:hypothetical protein